MDIQGGRAVRLWRGDPDLPTAYFPSAREAALHWQEQGASWLHVVDLDAATGRGGNTEAVAELAGALRIPFELGGGIRSLEGLERAFGCGAARAVLGTAAIRQPELVDRALSRYGAERVSVSIDAAGGLALVSGWAESGKVPATTLARALWEQGVRILIFTDVTRDGTLRGTDPKPVQEVRAAWPGVLWAGGGVAGPQDLELLGRLGVDAAIVGRALYEGALRLTEDLSERTRRP